jgi:hypothetical protein
MDERYQQGLAVLVAISGIALLALLAPSEGEDRYRLRGTVVADRGAESVVLANVSLWARDVRLGDYVDVPVFWDGKRFVAVREEK